MGPAPPDQIAALARERFGITYLYPIQRFVVSNVLEGHPQIVILPTGAGKSLCFLLPSLMLKGATLVVVPLLSLLSDQERKLRALGVPFGVLRGGLPAPDKAQLWARLRNGQTKLLLATLESCLAEQNLAALAGCRIAHVVVDEAHCITEWGETFRPAYLQVGTLARALGTPMVSAFTATASTDVIQRIRNNLFGNEDVRLVGESADRPGIRYSVRQVLSTGPALRELLGSAERPALVFCRTRNDVERAGRMTRLASGDRNVFFYHAGLTREERSGVEAWFLRSTDGVLFATCAYGMGVDKPDIRTVVHADVPSSIEAYLQESGRAGRDGKPAHAVLLHNATAERAHLARLTDTRARERFERMLAYAQAPGSCRRNGLLELIGQEHVACSGCDVCDGTARASAAEESVMREIVSRHPRRFTPAEAARILCARQGPEAQRELQDCIRGYGALEGWWAEEAEAALIALIAEGKLRMPLRGPWKKRLAVAPPPRSMLHSL